MKCNLLLMRKDQYETGHYYSCYRMKSTIRPWPFAFSLFLLLWLLLVGATGGQQGVKLNGIRLTEKLWEIANEGMGLKEVQVISFFKHGFLRNNGTSTPQQLFFVIAIMVAIAR